MVELPRVVLGDPVPTRAGPPDGPLSRPCATCGRIATAATITAAPPAALTALMALRLRARRCTRSNAPGGGASGWTSLPSQASTGSPLVMMPHLPPP